MSNIYIIVFNYNEIQNLILNLNKLLNVTNTFNGISRIYT